MAFYRRNHRHPFFLMDDFFAPSSSLTVMNRLDVDDGGSSMSPLSGARSSFAKHYIHETDNSIQLSIDVPGVKANDLKVQADDNVLNVSGSRKQIGTNENTTFVRSFAIDKHTADMSKMTANLADGVLVLNVPKRAKKQESVTITITENPHDGADMVVDKQTEDLAK